MSDTDTYAYQGAQDAGTTVHEYNTRDFHIRQALAEVRTALPVQVVRAPYDVNGNDITPGAAGAIGYVDVLPLVNQIDGYGNATPHGTICRIPYYRYQGANGAIISDPVKDDIGEIVVHDRDTSVVRATNKQGNPGSRRRHDFADGVYHGQQQAGAPSQYVTFTGNGIMIADKNHNSITFADNVITVKVGNATYTFDQHGNFHASGEIVAKYGGGSSVTLTGHTHQQDNDSHGDAEPDTHPATAGT